MGYGEKESRGEGPEQARLPTTLKSPTTPILRNSLSHGSFATVFVLERAQVLLRTVQTETDETYECSEQARIQTEGNAYLKTEFPDLSRVIRTRVMRAFKPAIKDEE